MKAFEATTRYFEVAAEQLGIDQDIRQTLLMPNREMRVQVTIERDGGQLENFIEYETFLSKSYFTYFAYDFFNKTRLALTQITNQSNQQD